MNEHTDSFRPYENVDRDLLLRSSNEDFEEDISSSKISSSSTEEGSPPPPALPPAARRRPPRPTFSQIKLSHTGSSDRKEFRLVRLRNEYESDLGLFIAKSQQEDLGCPAYHVAYILPGGIVKR